MYEASERLKQSLSSEPRFEVINSNDSDGFVTLFVVKQTADSPSFFELDKLGKEIIREFGVYIHKFYLYMFEQQKRGNCWFALDYSSGYHVLSNGIKIGVLKAYSMTPTFTPEKAIEMVSELKRLLDEFDSVADTFEIKEVPHKPRPFVFR